MNTTTAANPTVAEIRRYPVKAMGGEALPTAELVARGLVGDRWFAVTEGGGGLASGKNTGRLRRHDPVFAFRAQTGVDGGVSVHAGDRSWPVGDPALDAALSAALDCPVQVLPEATVPHFDAGPVSLVGTASLRWIEENLGVDADRRRLRPNLVVATTEAFEEEDWIGQRLQIGSAVLRVTRRVERCRTVDLAQDGVAAADRLLAALAQQREAKLAVYLTVEQPGRISLGDAVHLDPR